MIVSLKPHVNKSSCNMWSDFDLEELLSYIEVYNKEVVMLRSIKTREFLTKEGLMGFINDYGNRNRILDNKRSSKDFKYLQYLRFFLTKPSPSQGLGWNMSQLTHLSIELY